MRYTMMSEVSDQGSNPQEFTQKREIITIYEYSENNLIKQTEQVFEVVPKEDRVISVKSVDYEMVDELIKVGYQPKDYYAKNVTMVLTQSSNLAYIESLKEKLIEEEPKE